MSVEQYRQAFREVLPGVPTGKKTAVLDAVENCWTAYKE